MSATATAPAAPKLQPHRDSPPARSTPSQPVDVHHRGGRVLFEIRFTSPMSDGDLARLARVLDLSTHMSPKLRPDPTSPGAARLDHHSAQAAGQLDPRVSLPERLATAPEAVVERPLGQAAGRRLSPIRRRLAGLP